MLATLGAACSLLPEQRDQPRAEQLERAVLPMARAALNAGQTETARRLYRRLLQIDPSSVDARMGLGDAAVESREPATAAQWYLAALANARSPEARHAALLAHGRAALSAGQLEPARKSFARLTDPRAEASRSNVAWGYNGLGLTLLLAGDLRGATAAMEQAVLRAPDEPRFRGNLARALAMLTELESGAPGATRDDALASLEAELLPAPEPSARTADSSPVPDEPSSAAPEDARDGGEAPDATLRTALEAVAEPPEPGHEDAPPAAEPSTSPATAARESAAPDAAPADSSEPSAEPRQEDPQEATPQIDVPGTPAPEASVASTDGKAEQTSEETASRSASAAASRPPSRAASRAATRAASPPAPRPPPRAPSPSPTEPGADDASVATPPRVLQEDGWSFVQAASYASRAPAEALAARLREVAEHPVWVSEAQGVDGRTWSRVRIGPVPSAADLAALTAALEDLGFGPLVVPEEDFDAQPSAATPPMVIEQDGARFVQAGAYAARSAAEELAARLQALTGHGTHVSTSASPDHGALYRVRIGPVATHEALVALADRLEVAGYGVMDVAPPDDANGPAAPGPPPAGSLPLPVMVHEGAARFVQTGAYASRTTAEAVAVRLRALTDRPVELSPTRGPGDASLFRVRIGPVPSHEALVELRDALTLGGYGAMDLPAPPEEPPVESGAAPGTLAPPPLLLREGGERYLQAGAYSARPVAESLAARLRDLGVAPVRVTETVRNGQPIYRVRIGPVDPAQPTDDWLDAIDTARRAQGTGLSRPGATCGPGATFGSRCSFAGAKLRVDDEVPQLRGRATARVAPTNRTNRGRLRWKGYPDPWRLRSLGTQRAAWASRWAQTLPSRGS